LAQSNFVSRQRPRRHFHGRQLNKVRRFVAVGEQRFDFLT
jgi:hypothetical protein